MGQTEELKEALDRIETNSEGFAWATKAATDMFNAAAVLGDFTFDFAAQDFASRLYGAQNEIQRYALALSGLDDGPVSPASWPPVRRSIQQAYGLLWSIEAALPPSERQTFLRFLANVVIDSVKAVPEVAKAGGEYVGAVAGGVAAGAGSAVRQTFAGLLKEIWPVLLGITVLVGAGVYLALKGDAAVGASKGPLGAAARGLGKAA